MIGIFKMSTIAAKWPATTTRTKWALAHQSRLPKVFLGGKTSFSSSFGDGWDPPKSTSGCSQGPGPRRLHVRPPEARCPLVVDQHGVFFVPWPTIIIKILMQFSDTATKLGKFMFRWWPTLLQRDCSNFSCQTNYRWTVLFSLLLVFEDVWWCWRLKKKKCEYSYAYCVKAAVMTMTVAIPIMMKEQIRISVCSATRGLSRRRWRGKAGRFTTQCITNDWGHSTACITTAHNQTVPF